MDTSPVVIVGNGMAGHQLAQGLRRRAAEREVTLVGAESRPAYNRVLLSSVLAGTVAPDQLELPDPQVAQLLGAEAVDLDLARRQVVLADGRVRDYGTLVLATGTRPLVPPVPGLVASSGMPARGVTAFRTLADCRRIAALAATGPMAVLGGGLLGIEAARGLAGRGTKTTLVHPPTHLMERQLDVEAGAVLVEVLRGSGVNVRLGVSASSWSWSAESGGRLALADGSVVECAGVVVTAGVAPRSELARRAGLAVGHGVLVDDRLATSAPGVYAIGECAEHRGVCHGLVEPCWEQADVLADLLTGADPDARYTGSRPVVRLKARDIDLAVMGEISTSDPSRPGQEVIRVSDPARGRYGALALRGEQVVGAALLGLSEATGPVTQLFDSRAPAPADRFSLLLGRATSAVTDPPEDLPDRALICRCNGVTKERLVQAWTNGARDTVTLVAHTHATTGCGSCAGTVASLCAWLGTIPSPRVEQPLGSGGGGAV